MGTKLNDDWKIQPSITFLTAYRIIGKKENLILDL